MTPCGRVSIRSVHAALAHVAGSLSAAGAMVLTMRLPDPGRMLGMPAALARPLARRINELNGSLDQVAERFGTLHFDAAHDSLVYDRRMWSGMGAAPVHGPGSLPAGDGGAGVLGAAAGAAGAGRTARPGAGGIGPSWHRRGARPAD
jgi:hypothetical protein